MEYIKKAQKIAEGNLDRVRSVVKEILSNIEADGEKAIIELARKFDNWEGDFILTPQKKQGLIDGVPEQVKADIRYAHEQVTAYALDVAGADIILGDGFPDHCLQYRSSLL